MDQDNHFPPDHLEPRPPNVCRDCGRQMCRCADCQNAERGISPPRPCPCGEPKVTSYVSGVWYCQECYDAQANWRSFHNILTRGEDV